VRTRLEFEGERANSRNQPVRLSLPITCPSRSFHACPWFLRQAVGLIDARREAFDGHLATLKPLLCVLQPAACKEIARCDLGQLACQLGEIVLDLLQLGKVELGGLLWGHWGASATFIAGALFAGFASLLLLGRTMRRQSDNTKSR
jgi:hypothetical protein